MRISLPSLKPASSPSWYIRRTFSAEQPQRSAKLSGEKGRALVIESRARIEARSAIDDAGGVARRARAVPKAAPISCILTPTAGEKAGGGAEVIFRAIGELTAVRLNNPNAVVVILVRPPNGIDCF